MNIRTGKEKSILYAPHSLYLHLSSNATFKEISGQQKISHSARPILVYLCSSDLFSVENSIAPLLGKKKMQKTSSNIKCSA